MKRALLALVGATVLLGGAPLAPAAPVSWALSRSADPQQGTTSCRQDDGLTDYPISLEADTGGCSWRKTVIVPDWIRQRLTGLRAQVQTDVYYGDWSVSGLAPDGTTRIGTRPVANTAGRSDSDGLDPAAAVGPGGRTGIALDGGYLAGAFVSFARSGLQVEFDDSQAPAIDLGGYRLPARLPSFGETPELNPSFTENGPQLRDVTVDWGDGQRDTLLPFPPAGFWDGSENTVFRLLSPALGHIYQRDGVFSPVLSVVDFAGNASTAPLGTVRVGPLPLVARSAPRIRGRAIVGGRLVCLRGRFTGGPDSYLIAWQRQRPSGAWARAGRTGASRILTRADAGRRVRCLVRASRGLRAVSAHSAPVRVRAR